MCRFRPFVFFPHRNLGFVTNRSFLHSENRSGHNLVLQHVRLFLLFCALLLAGFAPIIRVELPYDKNSELLYMAENHAVTVSICTRCQQGTALHLSAPSSSICFCYLISTSTVLLSPTARLSDLLHIFFFYLKQGI